MYEREEKVYQGSSYAEDMVLDSWEGYVYWATSLRVEVAHLNGANHQVRKSASVVCCCDFFHLS